MIHLDGLAYRYPDRGTGSAPWVLEDFGLEVARGERLLVAGTSGSGKSSLLRTLNGLVPHFHGGSLRGRLRVGGRDPVALGPRGMSDLVGFMIQDPEAHFVARIVEDELAFAMENHAVPTREMRRRVDDVLERLGIAHLRRRRIETLSGGERQRVAMASVLALGPEILVLDEPTSQLDPASADALLDTLDALNEELGTTLVFSEHRLERVLHVADRALLLASDAPPRLGEPTEILAGSSLAPPLLRLADALGWRPAPLHVEAARDDPRVVDLARRLGDRTSAVKPSPVTHGNAAIAVRGLAVDLGDRRVLDGVDLDVPRGSLTAVLGPNGAGKSTLLKALIGLCRGAAGTIRLHGRDLDIDPSARPLEEVARLAGFVPQNPSRLLFHETAAEELRFGLETAGRSRPEADARAEELLAEVGLGGLGRAYPRDLSTGERQRLAVAAVLAGEPEILLLDEPTRGLDPPSKDRLVAWLDDLRSRGVTVVVATHDVELVARSAERAVLLDGGQVAAEGETAEVLAGAAAFRPQILRLLDDPRYLTAEDALSEVRP